MILFRNGLFLFICIAICCGSCVSNLKEIDEITSKNAIGVETGKNVEVKVSNDGIIRMKIVASETIHHTQGKAYTEFPKGVKAYSYKPDGSIESSLTARYAVMNESAGEIQGMVAKNDVVVINSKGEKLNTEELEWNQKSKTISTPGFVKICTPTQTIYGKGLDAKEDFSVYSIREVTGTVKVDQNEFP